MNTDIKHKGKTLEDTKICNTFLSRAIGLMFSKPRAAILKAERESIASTTIHTFFMRFAIDAIWLDKDKTVVDIRRGIKPYTFLVAPKKKAMYILELPAQKRLRINIGDRLKTGSLERFLYFPHRL